MQYHDETPVLPIIAVPRILVVAGDLTHRSIVARMVRTMGFPVWSSSSSHVALRFLRDHPREMGLLLADLALRRMDGGELAERARDLDPRIHIVLMAGPTDPHVDDLVAGYNYLPFVVKPVAFDALAAALQNLLGLIPAAGDPPSRARPRRRRGFAQPQV
jgi:two-component system cell cycle sensor histidine kinase/response regulator CckA